MNPILSAILVNVGSKVISNELIGDPDYPAQIGYGTDPTPQPGPSMDIDLPEGSEFDSLLEDADLNEEELALILQLLSDSNSPSELADGGAIQDAIVDTATNQIPGVSQIKILRAIQQTDDPEEKRKLARYLVPGYGIAEMGVSGLRGIGSRIKERRANRREEPPVLGPQMKANGGDILDRVVSDESSITVYGKAPRGEHLLDESLKDETLSSLMEPTWLITEEGQGMISGPEDVMEENLSEYLTARENEGNQLSDQYNFMLKNANKMGESFPGYLNRHHKNEGASENYDLFMKKYEGDMQDLENFGEQEDVTDFIDPSLLNELKTQKNILNDINLDHKRGIPSGEMQRLANGGDIGTIEAYEPSPLEKQRHAIANFLLDNGLISDNYRAQRLAEKMTFMSEFIPGFGDAQTFREGQFLMDEGSPMMGGIMMGASMLPFVPGTPIAKAANKLQQKIKKAKFDEQRELRNAASGDGAAGYNAADRHRKSWQKDQRKLDEMVAKEKATPNLEPKVTPKEPPKAVQQELNLQPKQDLLFHGSKTTGLKNLEIPKSGSTGGIYSLVDPTDPRFKMFSEKGSGYVLQPNFKNTLDVDNMPDDMLSVLKDIEMYRGRPSRGGSKKLDFQLDAMLRGGPGSTYKTPSNLTSETADIFRGQGYDALKFPPRKMTGEAETVISLDPSNLDIVDEIPYDDLDDFIRTFLND